MTKIQLLYPASIVIGCIILGGIYYVVQTNKQDSLERQQKAEIQQRQSEIDLQRDELKAKTEAEQIKSAEIQATKNATEADKQRRATNFATCMNGAQQAYNDEGLKYCLSVGYTSEDYKNLRCKVSESVFNKMEGDKQKAQDLCNKVYELGI